MNDLKKILVVDDQITNIETLRYRLQKAGYQVLEALRGDQAIEVALKEHPDLVLLDIMMPEITGFEVCQRLLQEEATKHIPIILVTALSSPEYVQKGFEVGAFDYVKKPFNQAELMMRIKSALKTSETNRLLIELARLNQLTQKIDKELTENSPKFLAVITELRKIKELLKAEKVDEAYDLISITVKKANRLLNISESKIKPMLHSMKKILGSISTGGNGSVDSNYN